MKNYKKRKSAILIPNNYELENLYDLDEMEYEHGEAIYIEEVNIIFEHDIKNKE